MQKLRLLSRVQDVLSTKRLHSELLDAGLLGGGTARSLMGHGALKRGARSCSRCRQSARGVGRGVSMH